MKATSEKFYWPGNIAKTRILGQILDGLDPFEEISIFDYGCGTAWGWKEVLRDYPGIRLIGFEPNEKSLAAARRNLSGLSARFISGEELAGEPFQCRYIVSLSVFEHVFDRRAYLAAAKTHLAPGGLFYLNYDDGHFRRRLDPGNRGTWASTLKEWLINASARPLARLGYLGHFQERVDRLEVDAMVAESGFRVENVFYSNLSCFKDLMKEISPAKRPEFLRFWMEIEARLNDDFLEEGASKMGDTANLWPQMLSRTLVLAPA